VVSTVIIGAGETNQMNNNICARINGIIEGLFLFCCVCGGRGKEGFGYNFCLKREEVVRFDDID
jgi:hypothetical protein